MEPYDFESSDRLPASDLFLLPVVGLACALWLSLAPLLSPLMALAALLRKRS